MNNAPKWTPGQLVFLKQPFSLELVVLPLWLDRPELIWEGLKYYWKRPLARRWYHGYSWNKKSKIADPKFPKEWCDAINIEYASEWRQRNNGILANHNSIAYPYFITHRDPLLVVEAFVTPWKKFYMSTTASPASGSQPAKVSKRQRFAYVKFLLANENGKNFFGYYDISRYWETMCVDTDMFFIT